MSNQFLVSVRVRGVSRQEDETWIAGFPRLDLYSQGNTEGEAKQSAVNALRLWVESCLDRGSLGDALRDLGWHRMTLAEGQAAEECIQVVAHRHLEDTLGDPWEERIEIPAYQAAELLAAGP